MICEEVIVITITARAIFHLTIAILSMVIVMRPMLTVVCARRGEMNRFKDGQIIGLYSATAVAALY